MGILNIETECGKSHNPGDLPHECLRCEDVWLRRSAREGAMVAAGNWREREISPTESGLYLVKLIIDGTPLYNVARWSGYWDMFPGQISHWAPLYSPVGDPVL